ncbi:MAG: hypothetical protein JJE10_07725 [Thermoleophilia bacterium]|nr:hypothetical protein [Thermoleophilia bacterium]
MSLFDRARERLGRIGAGSDRIYINDPRYDEWQVVREYEDLQTAMAFLQALRDAGQEAVLTSDWELDRYKRGDINLQVPPGCWSEAEELLSGLDLD